jgi:acyl dehydratase
MSTHVRCGLDELRGMIGREVGYSDWLPVTQPRIEAFAAVTEDRQWIHLDTARAQIESPYGTTIAHGFLTLSLLSQLFAQAVQLQGDFKMRINYGLNRVRFPAPVPAGSRIRGRFTLQALDDVPGGVQLTWLAQVEIEGGSKPALVAEWLGRLYF